MKAVSIEDLHPGMTLARTIVNDNMIVVLSENTVLTKPHITRLGFLNVPAVYIKDDYELNATPLVGEPLTRSHAFVAQYSEVVHTAQDIFDTVAKDGEIPAETVKKTEHMIQSDIAPMAKQSGAIDYLYELNHLANDVYNHSLRVSILAGVIAKWLRFDKQKTQEVVMAGFMHDIGKSKFTKRLLEKNIATLKGEDLDAYMRHTTDGHDLLASNKDLADGIKLTALQHHERMDGSGFPFGFTGKDIHEYARIIAVADIYDNITTEREGYVKETPFSAIARITEDMFSKLDPAVCIPFLTNIKAVFLGSTVTLSNGLQGTLISYPGDFAAYPLIRITQDDLIDLNDHKNIKIVEYNPK
ncbi:HD-GYP domain-containing protein [Selenomonas sp. TAMA-11512]|uniref:HD-GYP domain-containing protein n=1 Tax=Selenomonas sp. TAMA-11512 TaxID=3095337 RepID=UPI003090F6A0|nr:HD-GYP domain-containing protein [Selenomonas sp. TAMA-11512]